jgi:hypothetical protein
MLMLGKQPIVTERGTFQTLTLQDVVHLMEADEVKDIVEHDSASDTLDWINLDVAYAVLNSGGFDAAAQLFRDDDTVTTVSEFLLGIPDIEALLVHLAKCAVVHAVREGTVVERTV